MKQIQLSGKAGDVMFRATRASLAAVLFTAGAVGIVAVNTKTTRVPLPRSEALTRVASAQMLVFVPGVHGQSGGYIDGRPVPSGIATPVVVRWQRKDEASMTVSAAVLAQQTQTAVP